MKVLVTGSSGYLGSAIVPELVAAGHQVAGLDSGLFEGCDFGGPPASPQTLHAIDVRDVTEQHLQGVDAVVHLAALSNDPLGNVDPQLTYDVNHLASTRLARLARDAGVSRFLYASTCSVYGAQGGHELVDEQAAMAPVTPYAVSKVRVEDDLHELADDDFSPTYLRNATCFGVSARLRADVVLNNLVATAHLTGSVTVLSDGTPWRPLVHVRDVAAAVRCLLDAPRDDIHDEAFNVGRPGENHRVRELAALAADAVPGSRVVVTGETGPDPRSYRVDFGKLATRVPGFRPVWTAADGAAELAAAYRQHGLVDGDVARFTRLRQLQVRQAAGELRDDLRPVVCRRVAGSPGRRTLGR